MKEYGSDFHICDMDYRISSNLFNNIENIRFYACGRHAIDAIILQEGWKRIWVPAYFCYEVISHIKQFGIEIILYDDNPLREDDDILVGNLPYKEGDVLLRMNYFGLRNRRSNKCISVPVVEDHSHDLFSSWSLNSDADWCIASIRKSLPVAAGGILWSPQRKRLPSQIESTGLCEQMASVRYDAMCLKSDYLKKNGDKDVFREKYMRSERMLAQLPLSGIDKESYTILFTIDLKRWTLQRFENWNTAIDALNRKFTILKSFDIKYRRPFSLVFLCESFEERVLLRQYLIKNCIYPAILWEIPDNSDFINALDFSKRMLSIPCDARYNQEQIKRMCSIINSFYD
jgi:hypothetical protein